MMEQVKVRVYVSKSAALARGSSAYGTTEIPLTDADVASLSPEARRVLGAMSASDSIDVDVADVPHAIAGIELRAREQIERAAKVAAEREARIATALACDDQAWIGPDHYSGTQAPCVRRSPAAAWLDDSDVADERIVARRKAIEASVLPMHVAAWQAERDADAKRKAAAQRERDEQRAAYDAALRSVASRYDDLARAAAEGYRVERAVLDRLASELAGAVGGEHAIDTRTWRDPQDRAAPSPEAFALLDRVTAAVREANETIPSAIGRWVVSRIVRVDTCDHQGGSHYVTAVLATLETIGEDRQITFSRESLACDCDDDS